MKEADIRPAAIFGEFLKLSQRDIANYFEGVTYEFSCPACGNDGDYAFIKHGFSYKECPVCRPCL